MSSLVLFRVSGRVRGGEEEIAKSLRSKMQRRLRTLRRELAEPFYDKEEAAKLAAQQAALAAPKVPVRTPKTTANSGGNDAMDAAADTTAPTAANPTSMIDVEMADGGSSKSMTFLKPLGGVGKKGKKKQKGQRRRKGKNKRKHR